MVKSTSIIHAWKKAERNNYVQYSSPEIKSKKQKSKKNLAYTNSIQSISTTSTLRFLSSFLHDRFSGVE
uniref:Uncharacterized protein n=1 Tax=Setaria italica TaxID=4555 RepID=K4AHP0_SETIT